MNPLFSASVYQKRREQLSESVKSGIGLFLGNEESSMNYPSNTYKYRQDSNFLYFFGISIPHLAAVIDFDNRKTILFGDDFEIDDIIWMGDQPKIRDLAERVGISETRTFGSLSSYLAENRSRKLHFAAPYRNDSKILMSNLTGMSIPEIEKFVSPEFIKGIVALREIKEDIEISEMEKASQIGYRMHLAAMQNCVVGEQERYLFGLAEGITLSYGNGVSFPTILSQHGETLHNHEHNDSLQAGNMLLVDAGGENVMNYCSDNTRTFPVTGKFTQKQQEIYEIVLKAQMEGIAACRQGIYYKEVHRLAMTIIASGLKDLGLMKGNVEEAVEVGAPALFMPHGLGHQLGLDVHDMENLGENFVGYDETVERSSIFGWASLRMAKALRPGHIITVEPGIYFIPHLIDIWKNQKLHSAFINYDKVEGYRHFGGIRIEDDVLITDSGHFVFGPILPKTVAELAENVGSARR